MVRKKECVGLFIISALFLMSVPAGAGLPNLFALNTSASPQVMEIYDSNSHLMVSSWPLSNIDFHSGVAYDEVNDSVWIADYTISTLFEYDKTNGTVLSSFSTDLLLRGVAYDPLTDSLWTGHGQGGDFLNWSKAGVLQRTVLNNDAVGFVIDMDLDPDDGTLWCHDAENNEIRQVDVSGGSAALLSSCEPPYVDSGTPQALIVDLESDNLLGWSYLSLGPTELSRTCSEVSGWIFENFNDHHNGGDFEDHFLEPTPTETPDVTNTPSPSATPTNTPAPTNTPECVKLGTSLELPQETLFYPGDTFWLKAHVCNVTLTNLDATPTFVLLEVTDLFWFWPSWSETPDWDTMDFLPGKTTVNVIEPFVWPDAPPASGIHFYAAILNDEMTNILGEVGYVSFGWTR